MLDKVQRLIERLAVGGIAEAAQLTAIEPSVLEAGLAGSFELWNTSMVERLARAAGVDPVVVWGPGPLPEVPTVKFLRGAWPDFREADVPTLARALEEACSLRALAVEVLHAPRWFADADRVAVVEPAYEQGYRLASLVRQRVGNPSGPIGDLHRLASGLLHVHVVYAPLVTSRLHAVTVMSPEGAAVVVNACTEARPVMHRRTIAHELAHALFDPFEGNLYTVVDEEIEGELDSAPAERRARAFAAELLVPKEGLERLLGVPGHTQMLDAAVEWVRVVAARFCAPSELVANHLVNRRYVDKLLRQRLVEEVRGIEVPVDDPHEDWLRLRTQEALRAELISSGRAREILKLSVYDRDLVA